MAQLKPCPPEMQDKLRKAYDKDPIQHFVLWDTTYAMNEKGSCKVLTHHEYRTLRRCDGYDPDRYEVVAHIGDPL